MSATLDAMDRGQDEELTVRFRVKDAHVPSPEALLDILFGDRVLEGLVVGQSRNDPDHPAVVVQVNELDLLVVVSAREVVGAVSTDAVTDALSIVSPVRNS